MQGFVANALEMGLVSHFSTTMIVTSTMQYDDVKCFIFLNTIPVSPISDQQPRSGCMSDITKASLNNAVVFPAGYAYANARNKTPLCVCRGISRPFPYTCQCPNPNAMQSPPYPFPCHTISLDGEVLLLQSMPVPVACHAVIVSVKVLNCVNKDARSALEKINVVAKML